jgi:hypothetical protein
MIGKKKRAGSDNVDSSSHFPMIGEQLWEKPHIWFRLIEAQFAAAGIRSQKLKLL